MNECIKKLRASCEGLKGSVRSDKHLKPLLENIKTEIIKNNFSLLDDTPSRSSNFDGFVDHRHDQAIFSLLCLKHKVTVLSAYEFWYPANLSYGILGMDWEALEDFPIHAKRDKKIGLLVRIRTKLISSVRAMLRAKRRTRSG